MDWNLNRALWKLDNFVEYKKLKTAREKFFFAMKVIIITPFLYLDKILSLLCSAFVLWFISLLVRVMLKYLGE